MTVSLGTEIFYKAAVTLVLSVGGWIIVFPFRTIIRKMKEEWVDKTSQLDIIRTELTTQRTNCLATLQDQGEEQVELLKKAVDTLDAMHMSQVEMAGYLRGLKG